MIDKFRVMTVVSLLELTSPDRFHDLANLLSTFYKRGHSWLRDISFLAFRRVKLPRSSTSHPFWDLQVVCIEKEYRDLQG